MALGLLWRQANARKTRNEWRKGRGAEMLLINEETDTCNLTENTAYMTYVDT